MIAFIIPVKSEKVSSNWPHFRSLFERTVVSVCNQDDTNFKVVAVCHEIPEIEYEHPNIHFLQVDFDPPALDGVEGQEERLKIMEIDKGTKIKLGAAFAKKNFDADYIMTVDSDDFISNRIAGYVNKSSENLPGWYIKKGYIYLEGRKFLFATSKFSYLCGSSIIVKPEMVDYFIGKNPVLYFDHQLLVINEDIPLEPFPFSGGIYSMANGENLFMSIEKAKSLNKPGSKFTFKEVKRILKKLKNYGIRFITKRLRREFNFYT